MVGSLEDDRFLLKWFQVVFGNMFIFSVVQKKHFHRHPEIKRRKFGQKTLTVDPSINQEKVWGP